MTELKRCPICLEDIPADAWKCPNCRAIDYGVEFCPLDPALFEEIEQTSDDYFRADNGD